MDYLDFWHVKVSTSHLERLEADAYEGALATKKLKFLKQQLKEAGIRIKLSGNDSKKWKLEKKK